MESPLRALALCVALVQVAGGLPCPPSAAPKEGHSHHARAHAAPDTGHSHHAGAHGSAEGAATAALQAPCPCGCGESQSLHTPQRSHWAEPATGSVVAEARAWLSLVLSEPRLPGAPAFPIEPVPI